MSTWLIPNKLEDYDIRKGLAKYGNEIEWTKKLQTKNIATGDTVYIYMSAPAKALTMKFVVTDHNITTPTQTHNNDGAIVGGEWFKIGFLHYIEPIAYETLLSSGVVNGYIQAARKLKSEQENILNKYIARRGSDKEALPNNSPSAPRNVQDHSNSSNGEHISRPANTFKHQIHDGIVHVDDQPTLDKYVIYHAVAASSLRPKRDGLYVVTLKDGRKVMARWRGQRALEAHTHNNLIKQTTYMGNVRYYMYLSDADGSEVVSVPRLYDKIAPSLATSTDEEVANEIAGEDNLEEIRNTLGLLSNDQPPQRIGRITYELIRNSKISRLVKESKSYICEVCGREPFIQKNGKPYAEADHIKPLGGTHGGLDTPENMRCLCAQCHAVITHGSSEAVRELLRATKWQS